jgi:hypothetical protein
VAENKLRTREKKQEEALKRGNEEISLAIVELYIDEFRDDPQVITNIIGRRPSVATSPREGASGLWKLEPKVANDASLEDRFAALLDLLAPHKSQILECSKKFKTVLRCGVFYKEIQGGFGLSFETLKRVGDFGLPIEFDFYFNG